MRQLCAPAALVASLLSFSCGGARKAEPAEVEIQWPDAAVLKTGQVTLSDAGIGEATLAEEADAMPTP